MNDAKIQRGTVTGTEVYDKTDIILTEQHFKIYSYITKFRNEN